MNAAIVKLVVAAMTAWIPLSVHRYVEKPAVTEARYVSIAEDIVKVVEHDGALEDLSADLSPARTALLLASIASYEGGFEKAVDTCKRVGDAGKAFTLWQLHNVNEKKVCEDRTYAAHIALHRVRDSLTACAAVPLVDRLSQYASGRKGCVWALHESRNRVNRALAVSLAGM